MSEYRTPIKYRLALAISRLRHQLFPPNATCNNPDCGYRGRRVGKYIWCPACYDDGGGELIRDRVHS